MITALPHTGWVRWESTDPKPGLLAGGTVRLRIGRENDKVGQIYLLRAEFDGERITGYSISCVNTRNDYYIDVTFGPDAERWFCSCPDTQRVGRSNCKHARAVYNALKAIGL